MGDALRLDTGRRAAPASPPSQNTAPLPRLPRRVSVTRGRGRSAQGRQERSGSRETPSGFRPQAPRLRSLARFARGPRLAAPGSPERQRPRQERGPPGGEREPGRRTSAPKASVTYHAPRPVIPLRGDVNRTPPPLSFLTGSNLIHRNTLMSMSSSTSSITSRPGKAESLCGRAECPSSAHGQ